MLLNYISNSMELRVYIVFRDRIFNYDNGTVMGNGAELHTVQAIVVPYT